MSDQGLLSVDGEVLLSVSPDLAEHQDWVATPDAQWEGRVDAFASFVAHGPELADLAVHGDRRIVYPIADVPGLIAQLTEIKTAAIRAGVLRRTL